VPFPHVEQRVMTVSPAYVLTSKPVGLDGSLIWTAMITNALRPGWPDDVMIDEWEPIGLIIPSKIRTAKIATNEVKTAVLLGHASAELKAKVARIMSEHLTDV
jgi:mRNA interferase MazF